MRVDRFASCENIFPRFQTSSILPTLPIPPTGPWRKSSTASAGEFITVFIQSNEGLENKLTRAPLLGLAKSMCELSVYRTHQNLIMTQINVYFQE